MDGRAVSAGIAVRTSALDDVGDLAAEPGSRPWAVAVRSRMRAALKDERMSARHLQSWMAQFIEHRGYEALADANGEMFGTFESFCRTPEPFGLGYDLAAVNAILEERKSAEARARQPKTLASPGEIGNGRSRDYDISPTEHGDSADYLTARIARDHPAILERMKSGDYRSVRAAALDAGIVKPRVSVPTHDVHRAARLLSRHFDIDALIEALQEIAPD